MESKPIRTVSIEGIAKEAGVGKPTIYRWWDSKCAVVMDAFLATTAPKVPIPDTGSAVARLTAHLTSMIELLRGRTGRVAAEMIGEGQSDPHILEEFRDRFFSRLLDPAREILDAGKAAGEIDPDLDTDLALDMLYGPIYYRLLVGHGKLDAAFSDALPQRVATIVRRP